MRAVTATAMTLATAVAHAGLYSVNFEREMQATVRNADSVFTTGLFPATMTVIFDHTDGVVDLQELVWSGQLANYSPEPGASLDVEIELAGDLAGTVGAAADVAWDVQPGFANIIPAITFSNLRVGPLLVEDDMTTALITTELEHIWFGGVPIGDGYLLIGVTGAVVDDGNGGVTTERVDTVALSAVPEPSSWLFLTVALVSAVMIRMRRMGPVFKV